MFDEQDKKVFNEFEAAVNQLEALDEAYHSWSMEDRLNPLKYQQHQERCVAANMRFWEVQNNLRTILRRRDTQPQSPLMVLINKLVVIESDLAAEYSSEDYQERRSKRLQVESIKAQEELTDYITANNYT